MIISVKLDEAYTRTPLDSGLLTDDELAMGPETWTGWPDPFPEWVFAANGA